MNDLTRKSSQTFAGLFGHCVSDRCPSKILRIHADERQEASADVIFIHGLGVDSRELWTPNQYYWPSLFASERPDWRIYAAEYESSAEFWLTRPMPLADKADELLACIMENNIGQSRSLIFICHSMGGILAKQIMRRIEEENISNKNFFKAAVFFESPCQYKEVQFDLDRVLWESNLQAHEHVMDANFHIAMTVNKAYEKLS